MCWYSGRSANFAAEDRGVAVNSAWIRGREEKVVTVYLKILHVDFAGNAYSANLQLGTNKDVDGNPVTWFELVGENHVDDSGSWTWARDQHNFVCINLNSKKFSALTGRVRANEWGKGNIPPHLPHFNPGSHGDFLYIFAGTSSSLFCTWRVVKILS